MKQPFIEFRSTKFAVRRLRGWITTRAWMLEILREFLRICNGAEE
jgi:hypothetical protein